MKFSQKVRNICLIIVSIRIQTLILQNNLKLLYPDAGAGMNGIVEQCMMIPKELDEITKEIFRPYCVFCARKDVRFFLLFL
jgi:hypothetical protein